MVRDALRERFLAALRELGGSAGNGKLREALGWREETYWHVRDTLVAEGAVSAGRGRGGSVSIAVVPWRSRPTTHEPSPLVMAGAGRPSTTSERPRLSPSWPGPTRPPPQGQPSAASSPAHTARAIAASASTTTRRNAKTETPKEATEYRHPTADLALRPEIGTQANFRKRKPPATYRYDASLSPALEWDGQNPAREQGEAAIREILELDASAIEQSTTAEEAKQDAKALLNKARDSAQRLVRLGKPFLNWAGKAERLSFEVPTLPLFVHERLSTKAIIETLSGHQREANNAQASMFDFFGDPRRPVRDQVLKAYEYRDDWVNRLILGDSLVVMNSLLLYESLGGQVQMIYIDPPYGVQFGSNFQPFVRKREVNHNDDADMTREPEMVQAYRDTWRLGLHSYLSYFRDRLLLAWELLHPNGSIFVQISDDNTHHVRELMDEVFGDECHVVTICVKKKGSQKSSLIDPVNDYLLWYSRSPRDSGRLRFNPMFERREFDTETLEEFRLAELPDGTHLDLARAPSPEGSLVDYRTDPNRLRRDYPNARPFRPWPITNGGTRPNQMDPIELNGRTFYPPAGRCWSFRSRSDSGPVPMLRLKERGRLWASGSSLDGKRYLDDFPYKTISNWWDGLGGAASPIYVVQTNTRIVERCILMTTNPGDLVLDVTCGSGTTAYVAEQWGRRWITIDTSRVPLALARQRLLTATFPYYELKDEALGPAGGFVYKRRQNSKGEEIGGIVPHVTLKTIANDEPPEEEVVVDRPEEVRATTRVAGPFCIEATIPTPLDWDAQPTTKPADDGHASYIDRMLDVLRRAPVLQVGQGRTVTLTNIHPPAKSLALSAEAMVANGTEKPVALVFGPENGAINERLIFEAAREANAKSYAHLYVIGFAIEPEARQLIEDCEATAGIPATYITATPDLMMGDLLKTMRSSQIFSVCGLPEIAVQRLSDKPPRYQVSLLGLDVFDPATMETVHRKGDDVPCWMLDTDYNGLVFHGSQVFFPRTGAWDNLKKALKATHEETVWDHLAGAVSAPFEVGESRQIAVKVIDDRGNELMVVRRLDEVS